MLRCVSGRTDIPAGTVHDQSMTVVSLPPARPSGPGPVHDHDAPDGLERQRGLRPSAFAVALVSGGVAWYGLVRVAIWAF
jgi:hypothetical protein